ncbi:phage tail protein [Pseudoalteromonas rubra]|uniref:phage tail protein n=1 Tax=Pseudoalteromonas rubra TaxID=43658 RepID=UPI000F797B0E|nr:phage tail protein [Pseudoalteromonas rubra]
MRQMMSLGDFVFSLSEGTPYTDQQIVTDGGWTVIPRYGQQPLSQQTGAKLGRRTINGEWHYAKGMGNLDTLRQLQQSGAPQVLSDGIGNNLGLWTIMTITEKQQRVIDDGTAMVLPFTIELQEFAGEST